MLRQTKIFLVTVTILFVIIIASIVLSPKYRQCLQVFEFGVKHGVEDKRSGIKYATDAPGWKIVRNGNWTSGEKLLTQRLFAEPSASAKSDISIFMAGYMWGNNAVLCWALVAIVLIALTTLILRIIGRKRMLSQSRLQSIV